MYARRTRARRLAAPLALAASPTTQRIFTTESGGRKTPFASSVAGAGTKLERATSAGGKRFQDSSSVALARAHARATLCLPPYCTRAAPRAKAAWRCGTISCQPRLRLCLLAHPPSLCRAACLLLPQVNIATFLERRPLCTCYRTISAVKGAVAPAFSALRAQPASSAKRAAAA